MVKSYITMAFGLPCVYSVISGSYKLFFFTFVKSSISQVVSLDDAFRPLVAVSIRTAIFCIMTFSIMTFSIMTFSIMNLSIMNLSTQHNVTQYNDIITLSIMTLGIMTLSIMSLSIMDLISKLNM